MQHVNRATKIFFFLFLVVLNISILTSDNHHLVPLCFAAYGLGSIPFGYILSKYAGHDLKQIGSGSIGATNVLRTGNKKLAALTLILDAFKGWLAVIWLGAYGNLEAMPYIIASAVIIGHLYPVWLSFKGGKGVATGLGVLFALHWPLALITLGLWLLFAYWFRISSLAALLTVTALPFISLVFINYQMAIFCLVLVLLIFSQHIENINRLISGKEPKIGQR